MEALPGELLLRVAHFGADRIFALTPGVAHTPVPYLATLRAFKTGKRARVAVPYFECVRAAFRTLLALAGTCQQFARCLAGQWRVVYEDMYALVNAIEYNGHHLCRPSKKFAEHGVPVPAEFYRLAAALCARTRVNALEVCERRWYGSALMARRVDAPNTLFVTQEDGMGPNNHVYRFTDGAAHFSLAAFDLRHDPLGVLRVDKRLLGPGGEGTRFGGIITHHLQCPHAAVLCVTVQPRILNPHGWEYAHDAPVNRVVAVALHHPTETRAEILARLADRTRFVELRDTLEERLRDLQALAIPPRSSNKRKAPEAPSREEALSKLARFD